MSKALEDIAAERQRQIEKEGWSPEHDDEHDCGQLSKAAASYALMRPNYASPLNGIAKQVWPWDEQWWKPAAYRRNLVKAAALLVAEIERLDREEARKPVRALLGNGGDIAAATPPK